MECHFSRFWNSCGIFKCDKVNTWMIVALNNTYISMAYQVIEINVQVQKVLCGCCVTVPLMIYQMILLMNANEFNHLNTSWIRIPYQWGIFLKNIIVGPAKLPLNALAFYLPGSVGTCDAKLSVTKHCYEIYLTVTSFIVLCFNSKHTMIGHQIRKICV